MFYMWIYMSDMWTYVWRNPCHLMKPLSSEETLVIWRDPCHLKRPWPSEETLVVGCSKAWTLRRVGGLSLSLSLASCLSHVCLRMCFYTSWQNFANMRSPAKMTITARTVSKFRASTRSECPEIFFLDLKSLVISGIIEPWSECQATYDSTINSSFELINLSSSSSSWINWLWIRLRLRLSELIIN